MECRDSSGLLNSSIFSVWSCSLCFSFLFPFPGGQFVFNYNTSNPGLVKPVRGIGIETSEIKSFAHVCGTLDEIDCNRWKDCCKAAEECCQVQQNTPLLHRNENFCPRTWDGWRCFNDTEAGTLVHISCPAYIKYGSLQGYVEKQCTENGTWALHYGTGREWTDYSHCVNIQGMSGVVHAGISASTFSLLLLIPAVIIFLAFRQLRGQHRIQLHVCLFLSFIFTSVLNLLWELVVYVDRIENPVTQTFMFKYEKSCKTIYIIGRYATCTNYFWMFCEGLFLHRLLVHAFRSPRTITPYLVIGWVGPAVPVFVYTMLRREYTNDICWVINAGYFEWVLYAPNLLCIIMNMVFLLGILRILLTQLHQHPNEPSNYRRALKATFVLVPLFGLQLFLVIYRPSDSDLLNVYEIASKIIIHSQGGVIALVFCYFNGEVITCVKNTLRKLRHFKSKSPAFVTNYTVVSQRIKEQEIPVRYNIDTRSTRETRENNLEHIMLKETITNENGTV